MKTAIKRCVLFFCASVLIAGLFQGCGGDKRRTDLEPIEYELTSAAQIRGSGIKMLLDCAGAVPAGTEIRAIVSLEQAINDYNYYVVDWGDGTWSYNGPYAYGAIAYGKQWKVPGYVYHTYKKSGEYSVKACGINLEAGKFFGWTEGIPITVNGGDYEPPMIKNVSAVSSSEFSGDYKAENILIKGKSWMSKESGIVSDEYIGLLFDGHYKLSGVEIKVPKTADNFPSNISIDYTSDGGKSWYSLPKYYYTFSNAPGGYSVIMDFPNPKGATLVLPLHDITADGIRVSAKQFSLNTTAERYFEIEDIRAYGAKELLFYTSEGGTKDADLNNMWTIFGSAKTEPRVFNNARGGAPNADPFKSGTTQIGVTGWAEWNGLQLQWTDDTEATEVFRKTLIEARYGNDGYKYDYVSGKYVVDESEYAAESGPMDGYIWPTEYSPKHLGVHSHYSGNPIFIIAARNYLLWGNNTKDFLSETNRLGQTMYEKIEKAADYMINALDGRSGVMTIFDPRNDGTHFGNGSNYWDAFRFFGYKSVYENIMFYEAIKCMADIESFRGDSVKAAFYTTLAAKIHAEFNKVFWDNAKKRYISSIDINGVVTDFGVTVTNFMAVSRGLADAEKTKYIYEWLDGERIIESDTSKGADIYHYKIAARANTLDIATDALMTENGPVYRFWDAGGMNDITKWGAYGNNMQNGGSIFYITHYDLMGRIKVSAGNSYGKFEKLLDEFHKDELRRDPHSVYGGYQLSVLGEFPESGMVPLTFLNGYLGIKPDLKGLKIEANLPDKLSFAGVRKYIFGGREYAIEVNKNLSKPAVLKTGEKYTVKVPANKTYYITLENKLIEEAR